jgi:F-type H+-transporting ATPase subunit epsilon
MATPKTFRLEFVTPDRALVTEDVDEVQLPGEEGFFGVLPGHAPLLASLAPGPMWYRKGSETQHAYVGGGFAEVVPDRVSVLAPIAETADQIDRVRAEAAKRRAEERLQKAVPEIDFERARMALIRSIGRLDASQYARTRR